MDWDQLGSSFAGLIQAAAIRQHISWANKSPRRSHSHTEVLLAGPQVASKLVGLLHTADGFQKQQEKHNLKFFSRQGSASNTLLSYMHLVSYSSKQITESSSESDGALIKRGVITGGYHCNNLLRDIIK